MGRKRSSDLHLPARMYLKSGSYYFVDADSKWNNLGRKYLDAMIEYKKFTECGTGRIATMSELIDRYLIEIAVNKAEATYKGNVAQAKFLRAGLGGIRVNDLRAKHVYEYLNFRGKKGEVQANREFALLSHMMKMAIKWGVIESNPCRDVMKFKETPRSRYITDDEYLAFRSYSSGLIAAYMDFKLLTGLRKTDILKLKHSDLYEDGIHVTVSKTKQKMIIEWTEELETSVANIRALGRPSHSEYVFSTRSGTPYTASGFSSIWQRKMKGALQAGVLTERFTDHDIRAKTGSDAELAHATKLLGHKTPVVTERHYRRKVKIVRPLR